MFFDLRARLHAKIDSDSWATPTMYKKKTYTASILHKILYVMPFAPNVQYAKIIHKLVPV